MSVRSLDPSLLELDPSLRQVIDRLASEAANRAAMRRSRAAHAVGTTLAGWLRVLDSLAIPEHAFLRPGRRFPVVVRHSNARGFADDAIADGRGAAVRLLRAEARLDDSLLDLVLVTGQRFIVRDAATFLRWATSSPDERRAMLAADPRIADGLSELIRLPDSYAKLTYFSQTTFRFTALDGQELLVRYRLQPSGRRAGARPARARRAGTPARLRTPSNH